MNNAPNPDDPKRPCWASTTKENCIDPQACDDRGCQLYAGDTPVATLTVECSHCNGKGRVFFTGIYADTLRLLQKERGPINGADLARKHNVNVTAMENRLVRLESLGLARRERYGRENRWAAEQKEKTP